MLRSPLKGEFGASQNKWLAKLALPVIQTKSNNGTPSVKHTSVAADRISDVPQNIRSVAKISQFVKRSNQKNQNNHPTEMGRRTKQVFNGTSKTESLESNLKSAAKVSQFVMRANQKKKEIGEESSPREIERSNTELKKPSGSQPSDLAKRYNIGGQPDRPSQKLKKVSKQKKLFEGTIKELRDAANQKRKLIERASHNKHQRDSELLNGSQHEQSEAGSIDSNKNKYVSGTLKNGYDWKSARARSLLYVRLDNAAHERKAEDSKHSKSNRAESQRNAMATDHNMQTPVSDQTGSNKKRNSKHSNQQRYKGRTSRTNAKTNQMSEFKRPQHSGRHFGRLFNNPWNGINMSGSFHTVHLPHINTSGGVNKSSSAYSYVTFPIPKKYSQIKAKIGSLENIHHQPGGGDFRISSRKLNWKSRSRVGSLENINHIPGGGDIKITMRKLRWSSPSRVGSLDNIHHIPGGGDVKIVSQNLKWNGISRVGSLENINHSPGGGDVKITSQKLNWIAKSRISQENADYNLWRSKTYETV